MGVLEDMFGRLPVEPAERAGPPVALSNRNRGYSMFNPDVLESLGIQDPLNEQDSQQAPGAMLTPMIEGMAPGYTNRLTEQLASARSVQRGAIARRQSLSSQPAGMEDVAGAKRARFEAKRAELKGKSIEDILAELEALPLREGTQQWAETGDDETARAYYEALLRHGYNAGRTTGGALTWGQPVAVDREAAMRPEPAPPMPSYMRQGGKDNTLLLQRLVKMAESDALDPSQRAAVQQRIAQEITSMQGGQPAGGGGPAWAQGLDNSLSEWEGALGGGVSPADDRSAQVYKAIRESFRRRMRREPSPDELYQLWARLNGRRGNRRT